MPAKEASHNLQQQYSMYIYNRHLYYVYVVTNPERTVLYTGVTNNLSQRLMEHWLNRGTPKTFAGRYYCYNLIYFEEFPYVYNAIAREKELKGWRKEKKLELINTKNPDWFFLNAQVCGEWPPKETPRRY
jgi:putative endonuclease